MSEDTDTWQYSAAVCAAILPPIAVYIAQGSFDFTVIINIFLTLLLWFPGVFHALFVVSRVSAGTGDEGVGEIPPEPVP